MKDYEFKEKNFNEEYYYNLMDLSKFPFLKGKNKKEIQKIKGNKLEVQNNKNKNKHIHFDLTKNIFFLYIDKDYISKYKKYSKNNNNNAQKLKVSNKPIIKKFNIDDIKINKNYLPKEYLDEDEIVIESSKFNVKKNYI